MEPKRIIVGAGLTYQSGWDSYTQAQLDVRNPDDWRIFRPNTLEAILAEHVWEHLTETEGLKAATLAYHYLKPGGYLRLAVPDGFHPSASYRDYVKPGGWWNGNDHKVLYDWESLSFLLYESGFEAVRLLEFWTKTGKFVRRPLSWEKGWIRRSVRDIYSALTSLLVGARYTSLILDGVKN